MKSSSFLRGSAAPRENFLLLAPRENFLIVAPRENFLIRASACSKSIIDAQLNFLPFLHNNRHYARTQALVPHHQLIVAGRNVLPNKFSIR